MNFLIRVLKITIDNVEEENNVSKSTPKQRLANKFVEKQMKSYVLNVIPVKSTDPNELEKLCLLNSTIFEIERLFQMKENY